MTRIVLIGSGAMVGSALASLLSALAEQSFIVVTAIEQRPEPIQFSEPIELPAIRMRDMNLPWPNDVGQLRRDMLARERSMRKTLPKGRK